MKNLNAAWLALIITGVVFLVGSIFLSVYESFSGVDQTFNVEVVEFDQKTLLTDSFEDHVNNTL